MPGACLLLRRPFRELFLALLGALLLGSVPLQAQETPQNPAALQARQEALEARIAELEKADPPPAELLEVLRQHRAVLESWRGDLEERRTMEELGPPELLLEAAAEARRRAERLEAAPADTEAVAARLALLPDDEARRAWLNEHYEAPLAQSRERHDALQEELQRLTALRAGLAEDRLAVEQDLAEAEQALRGVEESLARDDGSDAARRELLEARAAWRRDQAAWLRQRRDLLEQRNTWLPARIEQLEQEIRAEEARRNQLQAGLEAGRETLQVLLERTQESLRRRADLLRRQLQETEEEAPRLLLQERLRNLELELEILELSARRTELAARRDQVVEEVRRIRAELEDYRARYEGRSEKPRPSNRYGRVSQLIRDANFALQASLEQQREIEDLLDEVEDQRERVLQEVETVLEDLDRNRERARELLGENWRKEEALWHRVEETRREHVRRLEGLASELGEIILTLRAAAEERCDLRSELLALHTSRNILVRGEQNLDLESLRQALADLRRLPAWAAGASVRIVDWARTCSRPGLALSAAALLALAAVLFALRRWLRRWIRRLLAEDLSAPEVRNTLTLLHLAAGACRGGFAFFGLLLASALLPDLGPEIRILLRQLAWIFFGVWLLRAAGVELLRPRPPERAIFEVEPALARKVWNAGRILAFLLLTLLPFRLALQALGYRNAGALDLLKFGFDILVGLLLIYLFSQRSLVAMVTPKGTGRMAGLVRSNLAALRLVLVLLVPAILVLDLLKFDILVGLITGLVVTLAGVLVLGYLLYQSGCFLIDHWLEPGEASGEARRHALARQDLARFFWRAAVILAGIWAVFRFGWLSLDMIRGFFAWPLPFQDVIPGEGEPVTGWDVVQAVFLIWLVLVCNRYLKLLLQEFLLPRTRLDAGLQYTITTLTGYLVVAWGVYAALNQVFDLASFGYVVAALSVGIGFGLQEIVSNFISGLILLFERPIKVGDTVNVAGQEGVVRRINIRATTIRTNDNIFILVPNREFITQNVVNYTHRDPVFRLSLPVGVAYGSDREKVVEALLEAAGEDPRVLSYPAPETMFTGFGDSSLDFELRVWIRNPEARFAVTDRLNHAIDEAFRRHGIEIPFPQRDLHLRSSDLPWPGAAEGASGSEGPRSEDAAAEDPGPDEAGA